MNLSKIDAFIAEKVMGHKVMIQTEPYETSSLNLHPGELYIGEGERIPHYSSDIRAAWEVVEKIRSMKRFGSGLPFKIQQQDNLENGLWCVETSELSADYHKRVWVKADTAPLAICLAALKAVGVDLSPEKA